MNLTHDSIIYLLILPAYKVDPSINEAGGNSSEALAKKGTIKRLKLKLGTSNL